MQEHDELGRLFQGRVGFLGYIIIVVLGILASGFWYHQVMQSPHYIALAERNRVKQIPLVAPRGRIYDREGRVLADNRPSYNIVLMPPTIEEAARMRAQKNAPSDSVVTDRTIEETAPMLATGIHLTAEELMEKMKRRRTEPGFRPVILKEDVAVDDIAFVKAHQYELPEISVEFQPRRRYLEATLAAHTLGYVGEVSEQELAKAEFAKSKSGDLIGRTGLERTYDSVLRGKDGFRRVIVNKSGREMGKLQQQPPIPGNDLYTTLDLDLQRAAEDMIGDRAGAAIAIDPRSGEVLVLASKPAFDPNLFPGIPIAAWNSLIEDSSKPLRNKAIQDRYSPGSVFKIFMAAAGLEAETLNPLDHIYCPGHAVYYGNSFACKAGGHGDVGVYEAIVHSCNVFFYNVGKNLGIDRIAHYTTEMGLGRRTGIDLPQEDAGLIPSPEWKQRVQKAKWFPGETISVAIGQGAVGLTPLQAAWAMGGLASGGRLMQPHLVKPDKLRDLGLNVPDILPEQYPMHQSTVDVVTRAMWGVVNENGTGGAARVQGFDVAGKTGTAQVVGKQYYARNDSYEDHAWFVGFAPYRNPEIVVAVFIEHGGHGGTAAAPVARAIFETYYRKRTGHADVDPTARIAKLEE